MGLFDKLFRSEAKSRSNTIPDSETRLDDKIGVSRKFSKKPIPNLTQIGNIAPVCPYCSQELETMPTRKKKCSKCGSMIFSRIRPLDQQRVLIREDQIPILEEDLRKYRIANKNYLRTGDYFDKYNREYDEMESKWKRKPLIADVHWAVITKEGLDSLKKNYWGIYRNTVLAQYELLYDEGKYEKALERLLYVSYLDVNGPNNAGFHGYQKPFSLDYAFIAPGVFSCLIDLRDKLGMTNEDLKAFFLKNIIEPYSDMPLSILESWERIEESFSAEKD